MAHDVFISHSSKDKPVADALCATLERKGVRCWIAPRDVLPGVDWGEAIIDAIAGSRVMVLIFSANANASPQIRREVERAVHRDVAIVPFQIDRSAPNKSLEYFISTPHWLDAMGGKMEEHLDRLASTVQLLLTRRPAEAGRDAAAAAASGQPAAVAADPPHAAPAVVAVADPPANAAARRPPVGRVSPMLWAVAGTAAVLLSGGLVWRAATRGRPAAPPQGTRPTATAPVPQGAILAPSPDATTTRTAAGVVAKAGLLTEAGQSRVYTGLAGFPGQVSFSADGRYLLSTRPTDTFLWDLEKESEVRKFDCGPAVFAPDRPRLAVGSKPSWLQVYDLETGRNDYRLSEVFQAGKETVVAFSPDGTQIAAPAYGAERGLWVARYPQAERHRLKALGPGNVRQVVFTADGRSIIVKEDSGEEGGHALISRRDAATGDAHWRVTASSHVHAVSPAGDVFAGDTLYAGKSGAVAAAIPTPPGGRIEGGAFTPDGGLLLYVVTSNKGGLYCWDVIAKRMRPPIESTRVALSVAVSTDGRRAVIGNGDGTVCLIDLKGWKHIANFAGGPRAALALVAFSPDGRFAAAAGRDLTVRVWRLPD